MNLTHCTFKRWWSVPTMLFLLLPSDQQGLKDYINILHHIILIWYSDMFHSIVWAISRIDITFILHDRQSSVAMQTLEVGANSRSHFHFECCAFSKGKHIKRGAAVQWAVSCTPKLFLISKRKTKDPFREAERDQRKCFGAACVKQLQAQSAHTQSAESVNTLINFLNHQNI